MSNVTLPEVLAFEAGQKDAELKYEAEKRKLKAYRKAVRNFFANKWYEGKWMQNKINAEYRRILHGVKR